LPSPTLNDPLAVAPVYVGSDVVNVAPSVYGPAAFGVYKHVAVGDGDVSTVCAEQPTSALLILKSIAPAAGWSIEAINVKEFGKVGEAGDVLKLITGVIAALATPAPTTKVEMRASTVAATSFRRPRVPISYRRDIMLTGFLQVDSRQERAIQ
jgi:hypothetical protein